VNQRGFGWITIIFYLVGAAALAVFMWGVYKGVERYFFNKWRPQLELVERERDGWREAGAKCSADTLALEEAGKAALARAQKQLADARKRAEAHAGEVKALEALLAKPTPAGAGCDAAWDAIEARPKEAG
jgi:hypothetical protein